MLKILFGRRNDVINDTNLYFADSNYEDWICNEESKAMIFDIDKSIVINERVIDSPILGGIPPIDLSGGVKALMLISNNPDLMFNATSCGNNCAKWLLKFGEDRDISINLRYMMDFGDDPFEIEILNSGKIVDNMVDLVLYGGEYLHER